MIFSNIDPLANEYDRVHAAAESMKSWHQLIPSGGFDLGLFAQAVERAMLKALLEDRLGRLAADRRERRKALAQRGAEAAPLAEEHRLPATPTIPATEDYFSAAPKCLGEDADLTPDSDRDEWWKVSDAKLVAATIEDGEDPIEALRRRVYMERKRALLPSERSSWNTKEEWALARSAALDRFEESQEVVWRTDDELAEDESHRDYLLRDEAPAPRGYGMTTTEMRRKWVMDAREVYREKLAAALLKHRKRLAGGWLTKDEVKAYPAIVAEEMFVHSVVAKWRFVDELQRHGVFSPDAETIGRLKKELCIGSGTADDPEFKVNYHNAAMELEWRSRLARKGQLDRYLEPIA